MTTSTSSAAETTVFDSNNRSIDNENSASSRMKPALGRAEFDVYHMDGPADFSEYNDDDYSDVSDGRDVVEVVRDDDVVDLQQKQHHQQLLAIQKDRLPQSQIQRPSQVATQLDISIHSGRNAQVKVAYEMDDQNEHEREREERVSSSAFNYNYTSLPTQTASNTSMATSTSSMMHFQHPTRYTDFSPYPTQSLRTNIRNHAIYKQPHNGPTAADEVLRRVVHKVCLPRKNERKILGPQHGLHSSEISSMAEVTPAFLRRAAQDLGESTSNENGHIHNQSRSSANPNQYVTMPPPPNSLMMRRDRLLNAIPINSNVDISIPDTSFYGADASALDGTFVSIRDLNDDDDVPSVGNERDYYGTYTQWNAPNDKGQEEQFPTETTSLLDRKTMPWQGGFFGSEVEKEDRRERRRMMRARKGWMAGWIWSLHSWLSERMGKRGNGAFVGTEKGAIGRGDGGGRWVWWENHPIGGDLASITDAQLSGGLPRRRNFSIFVMGLLCFHMTLCGLHDLFLQYLSYRHHDEGGGVSWNGEGKYIPAYWMALEGRVLNALDLGLGP